MSTSLMLEDISMASTFGDNSQSPPPTGAPECKHTIDLKQIIVEDLAKLPPVVNKPCIYKIPQRVRQVNPRAYTPCQVAIGPYHANDEELKPMEPHKLRCLQFLMSKSWRGENALESYIESIDRRESDARGYYSSIEALDSQNFKRMLLLDGAFVVAFLCRDSFGDTAMYLAGWDRETVSEINLDLLLLENQLPFFILEDLFHNTFDECHPHIVFPIVVYWQLIYLSPFKFREDDNLSLELVKQIASQGKVTHLLHLMRMYCIAAPTLCSLDVRRENPNNTLSTTHLLDVEEGNPNNAPLTTKNCFFGLLTSCSKMKYYLGRKEDQNKAERDQSMRVRYAHERQPVTKLHEVGIKFRAKKRHPMHIKFDEVEGVLEMSRIRLDCDTEIFLRNVIAYEQYYLNKFHITDHIEFMSGLISTIHDVDILEASRLMYNILNPKEDVPAMFSTITKNTLSNQARRYMKVYDKFTTYTRNPWKRWKAMLYRDYFGSPWAIISFIAAAVLLVLTAVQTFSAVKWH